VTNKRKDVHDRIHYLTSLIRLFQCHRCKFKSYQQIFFTLLHLRTAFYVRLFQKLAQSLTCLQILNTSHSVQTKEKTSEISGKTKYNTNDLTTNSFKTRHTFTYDKIILCSSLKTQKAKHLLNFEKFIYFTHIHISTSLSNYLSVADNARNADFLHVSSSSERQECENKT